MKINVKKKREAQNMEYLDRLLVFALFLLKQASPHSTLSLAIASPKAANIHNRW